MLKTKGKETDLRDKIEMLIFETLHELNLEREVSNKISITKATAMLGNNTSLDSLEFLNLVMSLEDKLREQLSMKVSLSHEDVLLSKHHPFKSVEALTNFIHLVSQGKLA